MINGHGQQYYFMYCPLTRLCLFFIQNFFIFDLHTFSEIPIILNSCPSQDTPDLTSVYRSISFDLHTSGFNSLPHLHLFLSRPVVIPVKIFPLGSQGCSLSMPLGRNTNIYNSNLRKLVLSETWSTFL